VRPLAPAPPEGLQPVPHASECPFLTPVCSPQSPPRAQAFELLELYLELLAVRGPLIASTKEIPRDMVEALSSVLYAASRRD
jgi:hypothetical protein